MSNLNDIIEDTYAGYGFNRQELTDFFYAKGKNVNFGLAPIKFEVDQIVPEAIVESDSITLDEALIEIDQLKRVIDKLELSIPRFLGELREDDPLSIAIQIRNQEWKNYDPDNRKTVPAQEGLIAQIIEQYKSFNMKDAQARAIEKVACPIKRK